MFQSSKIPKSHLFFPLNGGDSHPKPPQVAPAPARRLPQRHAWGTPTYPGDRDLKGWDWTGFGMEFWIMIFMMELYIGMVIMEFILGILEVFFFFLWW